MLNFTMSVRLALISNLGWVCFFLSTYWWRTSNSGAGASSQTLELNAGLRGAVAAAAAMPFTAHGDFLGGRPVRWGCNMSTMAAQTASDEVKHAMKEFPRRLDMVAWIANDLKYTGIGVELGVKQGEFAEQVLKTWPGMTA